MCIVFFIIKKLISFLATSDLIGAHDISLMQGLMLANLEFWGVQFLVFTRGSQMFAFLLNSLFFVLRGFKKAPQDLDSAGSGEPGIAEARVMKKWGRQDS